jgi:IstB-like ATP binding protein
MGRSAAAIEQLDAFQRQWDSERYVRYQLDYMVALRDSGDARAAVKKLSNYWDDIGTLVRSGHLDRVLLWNAYGNLCREWWALLEPWTRRTQAEQGDVTHLQAAHLEGSWSSKMRTYTGPSVLVIDELGYLSMDATSAHWIFQVVSRRYERGSIVLTSNRGFGDWGQVFADGSSQEPSSTVSCPRHGRQHQGPELSDAGPRPVRQGGRCYAPLTLIACALFVAISVHLSCSPTIGS